MNPMVDWLNRVSAVWSTHIFHAAWQSAAVSGVKTADRIASAASLLGFIEVCRFGFSI